MQDQSEQPALQAERVVVNKSGKRILDELTFTVKPGSITGLIGPSGSGKTTLIRSIVGVQEVSGGTLNVLGQSAGSARLRPRIGYVSQDAAVYSDLTVLQNLRYFATLVRADRARVDEILERVHLNEQRNQVVASLSGGQRARVSLAVALLGDCELLMLDEPTVGLDPLLRQQLWKLFADLARRGKTLVVSSHVMDEAERCESLLLIRDGKLLWNDTRQRLLDETGTESVEAAFIRKVSGEEA